MIEVRFLVGCDGGRSATRKSLGIALTGSSFSERWLIVDLDKTFNRLRHTEVHCNPRRSCIALPGPRQIRCYEFRLHGEEDEFIATKKSFVRRLLAEVGPDGEAPIRRTRVYTLHVRSAERWRSGNVFLGGDADPRGVAQPLPGRQVLTPARCAARASRRESGTFGSFAHAKASGR